MFINLRSSSVRTFVFDNWFYTFGVGDIHREHLHALMNISILYVIHGHHTCYTANKLRKLTCNVTGLCRNAYHRTQMICDEKTGNELTGNEKTGNDMTGTDKSRHRNDGDELTATKRRTPDLKVY